MLKNLDKLPKSKQLIAMKPYKYQQLYLQAKHLLKEGMLFAVADLFEQAVIAGSQKAAEIFSVGKQIVTDFRLKKLFKN